MVPYSETLIRILSLKKIAFPLRNVPRPALLLTTCFSILQLGQVQILPATAQSSPQRCKTINKILICDGDQRRSAKGQVSAFCTIAGRAVTIIGINNWQIPGCEPKENPQVVVCSVQNRDPCDRQKGTSRLGKQQPDLLVPYGSGRSILEGRPSLQWVPVEGADRYVIEVMGNGVHWRQPVTGNALPYPHSQSELLPGNAYQVVITAYKGSSVLSASRATLKRLGTQDATAVQTAIAQVKQLPFPQEQLGFWVTNGIYMDYGLLSESIKSLKAQIQAGTQDPAVYRLLADRYLEAGLPVEAEQMVEKAVSLAKSSNNQDELAKAQLMLRKMEAVR